MHRIAEWAQDRAEDWRDATWIERGVAILVGIVLIAGAAVTVALIYNARGVTGTIVAKDYTAAHSQAVTQCAPNTSGGCSVVVVQQYVPDTWTVTVAPDDGTANVSRTAPEAYWNTVQPGDRWTD